MKNKIKRFILCKKKKKNYVKYYYPNSKGEIHFDGRKVYEINSSHTYHGNLNRIIKSTTYDKSKQIYVSYYFSSRLLPDGSWDDDLSPVNYPPKFGMNTKL